MLCAAGGAAILLAMGWGLLQHYGTLLLVRSVLPALLVGGLLTWIVGRTRYGWPRSAALIAAVAVLLAITGTQFVDYQEQRETKLQEMQKRVQLSISFGSDPDELWLEYETERAAMNFGQYLRRRFGFEGHASDAGAVWFGPRVGVTIFGLELLLAAFVAGLVTATKAKEPACPQCGRWSEESDLGRSTYGEGAEFVADLLAGRPEAAMDRLAEPDTPEQILLSLALCPQGHDTSTGTLRIRERSYDRRGRTLLTRQLADLAIESHEQRLLRDKLGEIS